MHTSVNAAYVVTPVEGVELTHFEVPDLYDKIWLLDGVVIVQSCNFYKFKIKSLFSVPKLLIVLIKVFGIVELEI